RSPSSRLTLGGLIPPGRAGGVSPPSGGFAYRFRELSGEGIRSPRQLVVTIRDSSGGMGSPPQRYLLVGDLDVRMVTFLLSKLGHTVHERDGLRNGRQLARSLEGAALLDPSCRCAHGRTYPFS